MSSNTQILSELETIRRTNGGILRPSDTVKFAEDPSTALHSRFEWDDGVAGHQYRLEQARRLIRTVVHVVRHNGKDIVVDFYHNLGAGKQERGYETIVDIVSDKAKREELLHQAYEEMRVFVRKYESLKELAPVILSMRRIAGRAKKKAEARA